MAVQHSRIDVAPLTWEVPVTILASWIVGAALAMPAGQAAACMIHGAGFAWPQKNEVASIVGLLQGVPGVGLQAGADELPSRFLVYGVVDILELLLAAGMLVSGWIWWRTLGPGAQLGMASRRDIVRVLGRRNLRRRAGVIRPDLTGAKHRGARPQ